MDLRGQEIKNTYGNVVTIGSSAGSPTTGELTNGQNSSFTASFVSGDFGVGITPNNYANLNTLTIGSAAASAGGIIDFTGTSGRLASIYTEASGKIVLAADPTNGKAGTALEFNVDGSNAMFIDSSRNVGIGTTSPAEKLDIAGNLNFSISDAVDVSTKESLIFKINSANNQSNRVIDFRNYNTSLLTILQAGNVGIGTSNPQDYTSVAANDLVIGNASGSRGLTISSGTTNYGNIAFADGTGALDQYRGLIQYGHASDAMIFFTNANERMRITSTGSVGIGTSSPTQKLHVYEASGSSQAYLLLENNRTRNAAIYTKTTVGGFYAGTSIGTDTLCYQIYDAAAGERMRIDSAGNVGIGTTSPSFAFHLVNASTSYVTTETTGTGTSAGFRMKGDSSADYTLFTTQGANQFAIYDNANTAQRFTISSTGNVGIGTTTPETKLDVDGDIQTAAPETSTNAAWKLGNVGLGGVEVGPIDYITVSVGGFVVKLPIAIFPETQAFYDRVIADGGTFEGLLGYESAVTILKAQ